MQDKIFLALTVISVVSISDKQLPQLLQLSNKGISPKYSKIYFLRQPLVLQ